MTRLIILLLTCLIAIPATCVAQDTIFLTKQRQVYAKVLEIEEAKIRYKKYENLEGPVYSIDKTEILGIHYSNGTRDVFNSVTTAMNEKSLSVDSFLTIIKSSNLKVFVSAPDAASVTHAQNALQNATTWTIVEEKSASQIVIRFVFASIGMGDKKGKAQFLDPTTDEIIYETAYANTTFSWDVNTKRGVISKIVNARIKKLLVSDVQ